MKQNRFFTFIFAATIFIGFTFASSVRAAPESFAVLAEKLMPAVVNISIRTTVENQAPQMHGSPFQDFFEDFLERHGHNRQESEESPKRKIVSLGSGFVLDPSGVIVTNNHVIENADEITVTFSNGDKYKAKLLGRDAKTDLAVLQIEANKALPFVKFGDNQKSRVGDWVIAIGNPFGLGGSLSAGVISAINRDINSGPYDSYIQTDAAINRGNSGGPLFNMDGEVIGVNTAIISPTGGSVGIGFSIPADLAVSVIDQLRKFGETRRGWLGVRIQTVTDELAESLGMDKPMGALVSEVFEDGPADRGGLKQGDVILLFNQKPVEEMRDLPRIVAETEIGEKVVVEVLRRGKKIRKSVIVGRLEEVETDDTAQSTGDNPEKHQDGSVDILGMTLRPLDSETKSEFGLKARESGALIARIDPNGAAAFAGLRANSIITELDQQPVSTPEDVVKLIGKARKQGKKSVLVLLRSQGSLRFIALRIVTEKETKPSRRTP